MDPASLPPEPPPSRPSTAKSSAWPMVLGILGLVFGVGGLLGALWGLLVFVFRRPFVRMTTPDVETEMLAFYDRWAPYTIGFSVFALGLAVLLIFGCIALLRRRRKAVTLIRTWAIGKILYSLIAPVLMAPMQKESFAMQRETMAHSPGGAPPGMGSFFDALESAGPVIAVLQAGWLAVLPVVFLILFAMRGIREETRTWP